jgi:hypothetical protein
MQRVVACLGILVGALAAGCGSPGSVASTGGNFESSPVPVYSPPSSAFGMVGPVTPATIAGLQAAITAQVGSVLPAGTKVSAACPSLPSTAGASVHCSVTIAGTAVDWLVIARDAITIDASPSVGLISVDAARKAVLTKFGALYQNPTVDCGQAAVVIVKMDDELTCDIHAGDLQHTVHIVVVDQFGGFTVTP